MNLLDGWKIGEEGIQGRSMKLDLSKRMKDVKSLVSHVNAPQKATSAVKDSRNQVHRRTHSVDSQPLSPALPVIAHEQCGHGNRDGTYIHGLDNMDFRSPTLTWLQ